MTKINITPEEAEKLRRERIVEDRHPQTGPAIHYKYEAHAVLVAMARKNTEGGNTVVITEAGITLRFTDRGEGRDFLQALLDLPE